MENAPTFDQINKQNAALALIDGRGLGAFGGAALAQALLTAAREKASKQVLGDGPRWHAAIVGLEQLAGLGHTLRGSEPSMSRSSPGFGSVEPPSENETTPPGAARSAFPHFEQAAPRVWPERDLEPRTVVNQERVAVADSVTAALLALCPWRKGPFEVLGVHLDAEWRCDYKWARVMNAVSVAGKSVLDVGCGNGYYLLRALGAGARAALGIDPTWLYVAQFAALRRVLEPVGGAVSTLPAWVLPLALEDVRAPHVPSAEVVFSMGVLYHRKSPFEHLEALRDVVRPGGTLVLETLVVEGDERTVLVPRDRYAAMRNVWMIPSVAAVCAWLRRCGYVDVVVADVTVTTAAEQRATAFMQSSSLAQFLDPTDPASTVEGYPAPTRAIVVARRP